MHVQPPWEVPNHDTGGDAGLPWTLGNAIAGTVRRRYAEQFLHADVELALASRVLDEYSRRVVYEWQSPDGDAVGTWRANETCNSPLLPTAEGLLEERRAQWERFLAASDDPPGGGPGPT